MDIQELLPRLQGVKGGGSQYYARCPAHDDKHQSLSISTGDDGRILLKCQAGCSIHDITAAMGIGLMDLFPAKQEPAKPGVLNSGEAEKGKTLVATYNYTDEPGKLLYQKLRYKLPDGGKTFSIRRPDGKGGWIYKDVMQGVTEVLYNLPEVVKADTVYIVEGEKDVETLRKHSLTATCNTHGAGPCKWKSHLSQWFKGKTVIILPDNDDVGRQHANEVARNLHGVADSIKVLDLNGIYELPEHGDITDTFEYPGKHGAEDLKQQDQMTFDALKLLVEETAEYEPSREIPLPTDYSDTGNVERDAPRWEPPIPFDTLDTPSFPTESLPGPVAAFVEALAESTQTPEEMSAILSLGVLATAFQRRYTVEVTADWHEPLCLYPVAVAPPGERKTAVISALMRPVYEYEAMRRELEAAEIAQNQAERAMLEKSLAAAQGAATKMPSKGKSIDKESARQEALSLAAQLAEFKDLHPFRLLADDTTPEKLVDIMDTQGGCITVTSAEGGVFDSIAGRYDKGANFDIYLKGHAGDSISVDRIGRKSNYIKSPRLTMILTIQPEVLNGLMRNATFKGRGLCGRFLYSICKSKVGHRNSTPPEVPQAVKERYDQFVRRILSGDDSGVIRLSAEARKLQVEYMDIVERRLDGEWEHLRDWAGKLVGAMVRIAALIHASEVDAPSEAPIGPETSRRQSRLRNTWVSTPLPHIRPWEPMKP